MCAALQSAFCRWSIAHVINNHVILFALACLIIRSRGFSGQTEVVKQAMSTKHRGENLEDGTVYEWEWHTQWMRTTQNANGTTGWANILHSTKLGCEPGTVLRVHLCKHNPCRAMHPASKYGLTGPPIHLQELQQSLDVPAIAEASGANMPGPTTVPTAVVEASGSSTPVPVTISPAVADASGSNMASLAAKRQIEPVTLTKKSIDAMPLSLSASHLSSSGLSSLEMTGG